MAMAVGLQQRPESMQWTRSDSEMNGLTIRVLSRQAQSE